MSVITPTSIDYLISNDLYNWGPMALGDTGQPMGVVASGDRTVQVQGTFGAGGDVVIEGTLDGANWYVLHDPTGASLSFTGPGLRTVLENVDQIRPNVVSGDGTTQIQVIISARKYRNG